MHSDPILREVHRIKDKLAKEVGYDVEKMFDRLRKASKKHPERMVTPANSESKPRVRQKTARKPANE